MAIKDDGGLKITEANEKTTATTYDIAPSGYDASSTTYKPLLNSISGLTWVPGDEDLPTLPSFDSADLLVVGDAFVESGVLSWQSGAVTGVDIVLEEVAIPYLDTVILEYNITPSSAPDLMTTWTSSDETIVEILGDGEIKGLNPGTATVTVTTRDGGYIDTILVTVEDYEQVTSYEVTTDTLVLPEANNADIRDEVTIGTVATFTVTILPENADYPGYTITTSNSRAEVEGNTVTFVYGSTGPGNVSVYVTFEDSSVETLNYRFKTVESVQDIPIESVTITTDTIALPEANNADIRDEVNIGTVAVFSVDIDPVSASNQNYTITTSNSRAEVDGHTVTFVLGSGAGSVSVYVTFEDPAIGELNYRFTTVEVVDATSYTVDTDGLVLPEPNNSDDRDTVDIDTVVTFSVLVLPEGATYSGYTITTSNSRAVVDGDTVTFVYGNTGPGSVSVYITFDDPNLGELNYRFTTVDPSA
ncbi:Ig-like domain-containing protein [Mycoplasmatota bacterium]|nr:Ig-like domain-containing protein [Mycoplasmatota bacterium]